jgi:thiol-disulfide isomerase/thioredoxin
VDSALRPLERYRSARKLFLFLTCLAGLECALRAEPPPANGDALAPPGVPRLKGIDLNGRLQLLGEGQDCKAVVVVFFAPDCPRCKSRIPDLNQLAGAFSKRAEFYAVLSDDTLTRAAAIELHKPLGLRFPVLFDASGELRQNLQATHAPQVFVLTPLGEVKYGGRIDDRGTAAARKDPKSNRNYLSDALSAVIGGRPVAVAKTEPDGTPLKAPLDKTVGANVTYTRDIAPLLQAYCVTCHRPGEVGPFPLLTYEDVRKRAGQIAVVTKARLMPPWKPVLGFGHFRDERMLTDREIAMLEAWAELEHRLGRADDLPPPPKFTDGWQLGKPDVVLDMPGEFEVPATSDDLHQHFVLPLGLKEDRLVAAVEFRPGNTRVVHHACFFLDTTGSGRKLDEADPGLGYGGGGGVGFLPQGGFASWLPGTTPQRLPNNSGRLVRRTSDLVLQIHYQCSGKPERDKSQIGIFYAPPQSRQIATEIQVLNMELEIPAGASWHRHRASYTLPADAVLLDAAPHMHKLGREMRAVATLPDGRIEPLIRITDWDFNWQGNYTYVTPVRLPRGTRIDVDTFFDNSPGNPLNPNSPPRTVKWGEQTRDEMAICSFQLTCDRLKDLALIYDDYQKYVIKQYQARDLWPK